METRRIFLLPNQPLPCIAKEGGAIWKSMTESEKAPYFAKAARKKAEYEIAIKQHIDNLNQTAMEISTSSSMNAHEDVEQEIVKLLWL
ncbi:putative chromatin remodeling & transcriptional activation HMG family [Helianthus debilis subsp. tardiflorus]